MTAVPIVSADAQAASLAGRQARRAGARGLARTGNGLSVAAPDIAVANSIGAGDVFNAAFLKADMRGAPLQDALSEAVAFASAVIATRPRSYAPP